MWAEVFTAADSSFLALIFLVAAFAKATDRSATSNTFAGYGALPQSWAVPATILFPPSEALVGALLLVPPLYRFGASAALILLLGMAAVVSVSVWRGAVPDDCACFGSLHSEHPSWHTVLRIVFLASLTVVIVIRPIVVSSETYVIGLGIAVLTACVLALIDGVQRLRLAAVGRRRVPLTVSSNTEESTDRVWKAGRIGSSRNGGER